MSRYAGKPEGPKTDYIYAYSYRWDESTPVNNRTKAAKIYFHTKVEQIGGLMDGWMEIKKLSVVNGGYAPADRWWVDPVLTYEKAEEPGDTPILTGNVTLEEVARVLHWIKNI